MEPFYTNQRTQAWGGPRELTVPPWPENSLRVDPEAVVENATASVAAARPVVVEPALAHSASYRLVKRALDLVLGLTLLLACLPLMLIVGVIVRLDSSGPILFRQIRVGQHGHLFVFYKFRTMWVDARDRFPELYAYHYTPRDIETMYFKCIDDPRLTRFGRWLRRTSLDELPNLINVVRGDMSLVGPRPEIPEMVRYYSPEQLVKFAVKPGLSGLAQVSGRAVLRFQETIAADLHYIEQRSLLCDITILLRTVKVVVARVGAF